MMNKLIIIVLAMVSIASCRPAEKESDAWGNFETREIIIAAQAGGRLIQFDLQQGQILPGGSLAALIDTVQYALELRQITARKQPIQARLADIDANIVVLDSQKQNIEREVERTQRLLKDQAATPQQLDDMMGKAEVLRNQIHAAKVSKNSIHAELQGMDAQMAIAQEKLSQCRVVNPITGTVLEKYMELHELVMPGKPLYKIADLTEMELRVYASGAQLPHIQYGQKVKVFIDDDARSNQQMEGTITWISSQAEFTPKTIQTKKERVSQVYAVKISVPNDGSIKIGMPGEVRWID